PLTKGLLQRASSSQPRSASTSLVALPSTAALAEHDLYRVLSSSTEDVRLRFRNVALRDEWPDDVELQFNETELYVVFHTGTRRDRELLLAVLQSILARCGSVTEFLEV